MAYESKDIKVSIIDDGMTVWFEIDGFGFGCLIEQFKDMVNGGSRDTVALLHNIAVNLNLDGFKAVDCHNESKLKTALSGKKIRI